MARSRPESENLTSQPRPGDRLESWKEIATYLNRDVTTVQRWEKKEGLPVHRHVHEKKSSVYAFRSELDDWQKKRGNFEGQVSAPEAVATPRRKGYLLTKTWLWLAGTLFMAGIVIALWLYLPRSEPNAPLPRTVPLTSYEGSETDPALSPDGKQVAFVWDGGQEGARHLFVKLAEAGDPVRLTDPSYEVRSPAWSPDGDRIAFYQRIEGTGYEILEIPAFGGHTRRLGSSAGWNGLSWSPDGNTLAVLDKSSPEAPHAIFLLSRDTGEKRQFSFPPIESLGDRQPAFSPDGRTLAFIRRKPNMKYGVYVQKLFGEEPTLVATTENTGDTFVWDVDWTSDGNNLVFSTGPTEANGYLMKVAATGGVPSRLPFGDRARFLSISREGDWLAYVEWIRDRNIWRVGRPAAAERSDPVQFIASTRDDIMPTYSPDGSKIAFISDRGGTWEVWTSDGDGANPRQLTNGGRAIWPRWSPSGGRIACGGSMPSSDRPGVFVVDAASGFARKLTPDTFSAGMPDWSADERWIYFFGLQHENDKMMIWRAPAVGGQALPLNVPGWKGYVPANLESHDGRVYYSEQGKLWVVPEGGERTLVLDGPLNWSRWTLWRGNLVYVDQETKSRPTFMMSNLTTGQTTEIVSLPPQTRLWLGVSVSPHGRWMLYTQLDRSGADLMLVENFH